jgi:ABC-2 type transport system ATP-binding protein
MYGIKKDVLENRIEFLLSLFSIDSKKNVSAKKLSGGMRKKLNIICALIHNPHILILDEPTAGLDPISKRDLWNIIKQINEKGTTIIITSHLMEDIETLCDRVAILVSGNIRAKGTLQELKRFVNISILRLTINPYHVDEVENILERNKIDFELLDNIVMLRTQNPQNTYNSVRYLIDQYIQEAESISPTIEDVFLYFVGKKHRNWS